MTILVYIAGPYTHPEPGTNVHEALRVATYLLSQGYAPYVPHLNYLWQAIYPQEDKVWHKLDIDYLKVCHALLRFGGASKGADNEERIARELKIPVFYTSRALIEKFPLHVEHAPTHKKARKISTK